MERKQEGLEVEEEALEDDLEDLEGKR